MEMWSLPSGTFLASSGSRQGPQVKLNQGECYLREKVPGDITLKRGFCWAAVLESLRVLERRGRWP